MALRYSVSSGDQAEGPTVPDVALGDALGDADWESDEPEQAVSTRPRLTINVIAAVFEFFESIFSTR